MSWTVPAITLASLVVAGGVVATQTDIDLLEKVNPWSAPAVEQHIPVDTLVELCRESPVAALESDFEVDAVDIRTDVFGVSQVVFGEFDGAVVPNHIAKMREAELRSSTAASPDQIARRLQRVRNARGNAISSNSQSRSSFAPKNFETRDFFTQSRYAESRGVSQPKYYKRHYRGSFKRPQRVNLQSLNSTSRAVRSNRFDTKSIMEGTRFESIREATDRKSVHRGRQVNKTYIVPPQRKSSDK